MILQLFIYQEGDPIDLSQGLLIDLIFFLHQTNGGKKKILELECVQSIYIFCLT